METVALCWRGGEGCGGAGGDYKCEFKCKDFPLVVGGPVGGLRGVEEGLRLGYEGRGVGRVRSQEEYEKVY